MRHCVYIFDIEEVLPEEAMKKFTILTIAPALALFAVGCSSPTAMQSTEYDDMYYSAADKTEYAQPAVTTYAQAEEQEQQQEAVAEEGVRNPEYSERSSAVTDNYYGDEYYDGRDYDPRDNWYRPNYSFVDPSWAYDPYPTYSSYSYNRSYRHRHIDPFYDPFYYDPFYYDPFAYRPYWRNGVTIAVIYSYGWGGHYGRYYPYYGRYYNPYYSPWYPHYNYYHGGYYGRQYVYDYPRYNNTRKVQYGPRGERGGVVTERTQRGARTERGTLTEGSEERATQGRPARTTERAGTPAAEGSKEVITTRPDRGRDTYTPRGGEARPVRERTVRGEEQREQPATRPAVEPRTTREPAPRREVRQEQRSTETRQSPPPRRETPERTSEQRETRSSESAPSRSSGSENNNNSRSTGGRPPRGN